MEDIEKSLQKLDFPGYIFKSILVHGFKYIRKCISDFYRAKRDLQINNISTQSIRQTLMSNLAYKCKTRCRGFTV